MGNRGRGSLEFRFIRIFGLICLFGFVRITGSIRSAGFIRLAGVIRFIRLIWFAGLGLGRCIGSGSGLFRRSGSGLLHFFGGRLLRPGLGGRLRRRGRRRRYDLHILRGLPGGGIGRLLRLPDGNGLRRRFGLSRRPNAQIRQHACRKGENKAYKRKKQERTGSFVLPGRSVESFMMFSAFYRFIWPGIFRILIVDFPHTAISSIRYSDRRYYD